MVRAVSGPYSIQHAVCYGMLMLPHNCITTHRGRHHGAEGEAVVRAALAVVGRVQVWTAGMTGGTAGYKAY